MDRQKSLKIIRKLRRQYGEVKPALDYRDRYELCVAVVLSAQTTDRQVNLVTPTLFTRYPDFARLAEGTIKDIETIIRSTGFYHAKAKNISALAQNIMTRFNGILPSERNDLESLPGVGRKSANVILSQGFGIQALAVDTHVGRLARRIGYSTSKDPLKIEADITAMVPMHAWTETHLLLITHGRAVCTARKPACSLCPILQECGFEDKNS